MSDYENEVFHFVLRTSFSLFSFPISLLKRSAILLRTVHVLYT